MQVVLFFGLAAALVYYIVRGLPSVSVSRFEPFAPGGWTATLSTAGFVFVSFGGLLKVASVAEEVKDPGRVVPLGMILSLTIVSVLYFFAVFVTAGVMGWAQIHLNPFNSIVIPILIGIGLDDGIHIYRRYQEISDMNKTLATTGRSVLVTSWTTMARLGSLSLADYHILRNMGIMAIVGVIACYYFSVITLPVVLQRRG